MHTQSYSNPTGYLFIVIGLFLSVVSALVPHFQAGYTLMLSVFIAGMLPYVVYGIMVPLLRSALVTITGLVIVVIHTWLVINQRIIGNSDYSDGVIYIIPMALAVATLPLGLIACKKSGIF